MAIIESARALLIDPHDRVLLMKLASDRAMPGPSAVQRTCWLTPGGTLEPGESYEDALLREVLEETGLRLRHPGQWVWTSPKRIERNGLQVDTLARVYIQRVSAFEAMPTALTAEECRVFRELRWWGIDEIATSSETFVPGHLAQLLQPLLSGAWPNEPIRISP